MFAACQAVALGSRNDDREMEFMYQRHMSIDVVQPILVLVLITCPLARVEFRPVAVWTDAECYSNPPGNMRRKR